MCVCAHTHTHTRSHRDGLVAALSIHLAAVLCQWHFLEFPESPSSAPPAAAAAAAAILDAHLGLAAAYSAGILLVMWRRPALTKWCGRHFVPVKALHLAASVAAFAALRGEGTGWALVFCVDTVLLHCWMGALSFRNTAILTGLAAAALVAAMPAARDFQALPLLGTAAFSIGAIWTARISNYRRGYA